MQQAGAAPDAVVLRYLVNIFESSNRNRESAMVAGEPGQLHRGVEGTDGIACISEGFGITTRPAASIEDPSLRLELGKEPLVDRCHVHADGRAEELGRESFVVVVGPPAQAVASGDWLAANGVVTAREFGDDPWVGDKDSENMKNRGFVIGFRNNVSGARWRLDTEDWVRRNGMAEAGLDDPPRPPMTAAAERVAGGRAIDIGLGSNRATAHDCRETSKCVHA